MFLSVVASMRTICEPFTPTTRINRESSHWDCLAREMALVINGADRLLPPEHDDALAERQAEAARNILEIIEQMDNQAVP